jgi:hypothetical protein
MKTSFISTSQFRAAAMAAVLALVGAASAQNTNAPGQAKKQAAAAAPASTVPPAKVTPAVAAPTAVTAGSYLSEAQRKAIQDYYASQRQRTGRCPPGLAKKNNGCMPPGQAKKWAMGQPLGKDVVYQPVPEAVLKKIGTIQKGLEIVRILNDIIVLQKGDRMVLDAVEVFGQP